MHFVRLSNDRRCPSISRGWRCWWRDSIQASRQPPDSEEGRTVRSAPLTSRRGRFQSANLVVSHLPIEIRCNLYWLCITEQRIAFVRPHYVASTDSAISSPLHSARIDETADVFCRRTTRQLPTFKTWLSVNGVTMTRKEWVIYSHSERRLLLVTG